MAKIWSIDSLPIMLKGNLLWAYGILAIVWVAVFLPLVWWLLSNPESAPPKSLWFAIMVFVVLPVGAAIDFHRGRHRLQLRVTQEGVAVEGGTEVDFDRFAACSGFRVFGFALRWKAETAEGMKERSVGLEFGLSRQELLSLCAFLNELSAAARATRTSA